MTSVKLPTTTSHPTTSRDPDLVYGEYLQDLAMQLWRVFPPILLVVGSLGNIMSIAVLSQRNMRKSNAAVYLIVLSVADILVLYTGLLRQWLRYYFHIDIRHFGDVACKVHTWLVYATLDLSVWVLVALTFERLVSVYLPHRVKRHCTTMTSCIVLSVTTAVLLGINSHFLHGMGDVVVPIGKNRTYVHRCVFLYYDYKHFATKVWPWIDLSLYSLLPLSIILVSNIAIVVKVILSRQRARRVHPTSAVTFQVNGRGPDSRSKQISSMTAILVVLNIVLLITTMPISAYLIVEPYIFTGGVTYLTQAEMTLAWAVVNLLQYTNNSINFLLYCLSGSRFREELRGMFHCRRRVGSLTVTNTHRSETMPCRSSRTAQARRGEQSNLPPSNTTQTTYTTGLSSLHKSSSVWTLQTFPRPLPPDQQREEQQQTQQPRLQSSGSFALALTLRGSHSQPGLTGHSDNGRIDSMTTDLTTNSESTRLTTEGSDRLLEDGFAMVNPVQDIAASSGEKGCASGGDQRSEDKTESPGPEQDGPESVPPGRLFSVRINSENQNQIEAFPRNPFWVGADDDNDRPCDNDARMVEVNASSSPKYKNSLTSDVRNGRSDLFQNVTALLNDYKSRVDSPGKIATVSNGDTVSPLADDPQEVFMSEQHEGYNEDEMLEIVSTESAPAQSQDIQLEHISQPRKTKVTWEI